MNAALVLWIGLLVLHAGDADPVSRARALAKDHRAEAIRILNEQLESTPQDSDARTLRGTILSWDGRYDEARADLRAVLAAHPGYRDALQALINVEMWSGRPAEAEKLASAELAKDPNDAALLVARAKALRAMNRYRESREVALLALKADPQNRAAKDLRDEAGPETLEVMIGHSSDWFSDGRASWREEQLSVSRPTAYGTVIGRLSDAGRFGLRSQQGEVDFYPHIRRGMYAFVSAGFSPDANLYPRYRAGLEIYQSLPQAFEASAGYRRLSFGSGINIYTASVTKYRGQWALTGRSYLIPDQTGVSKSAQFTARRYLGEGHNYWTVRGSFGASPTGMNSVTDLGVLRSSSVSGEFAHSISRRLAVLVQTGLATQDRIEASGLNVVSASFSLYYRF